ncbi:HD-GYP domain-containing protein [Pseudoalteromonas sp. JBTF-M23]|uniref:HD-GYP domain-containing protein n=1 Tax=Pseudoalteromonas caenipelagi TaxID=2726988 RepID=A0A849VE62_9GAMM|nr:HD-GYP domain-containing protein [Pseudoalteromonas caenipelagi]NOU51576.1 HD-GYP domain-containing protein [Pseudoalteromonas caenipelagi]
MRVTLPISELKPGMFVDSVHKQRADTGVKIKSRGMVRDSDIIDKLSAEGVLELNIDFDLSEIAVPEKYQVEAKKERNKPEATKLDARERRRRAGMAGEKQPSRRTKKRAQESTEPTSLEREFELASQAFELHNRKIQILYGDVTSGLKADVGLINQISKEIVESVLRNSNAMAILTRLQDREGYNWRHMINCAILISVFAKYLGLSQSLIQQLAMGAMLHDVGHARLPQGLVNKQDKLTDIEYKAVKKHVVHSLGLVKGEQGITPMIMDMIINHHERIDGTGYPRGLKGLQISKAARMMAIVDVYDAMTSERPYQQGEEPVHALRHLLTNKDKFDPVLVQRFIKCLGVHPVGSIVKLTNERLALVLAGNKHAPTAPHVRIFYNTKHMHHITAKELDLSSPDHDIKVIASIRPLDYQINLSRLLKDHLLA